MKRAYCLCQVSTKGQVDHNDLPLQRLACQEFAVDKGWSIEKEFYELGVSGYKVAAEDRDAIQQIREVAVANKFDVLLVFMFDRLGRQEDETPFMVQWFVSQGVEIWSVREGQQRFDNQVDKLMNYIRFWQAASESAKSAERISTRKRQMCEQGYYSGGFAAFGYSLSRNGRVNKKNVPVHDLEVIRDEAEVVREVFSLTVQDQLGPGKIASLLNKRGLRTHQGKRFSVGSINRMLENKLYIGFLHSKDSLSPHIPELQIVDDDIFAKVQQILQERKANNKAIKVEQSKDARDNPYTLLRHNLFCAHCGGKVVPFRSRSHYKKKNGEVSIAEVPRYVCYHKSRKLNDCDGACTYRAEKVDDIVCNIIISLLSAGKEQGVSTDYLRELGLEIPDDAIFQKASLKFKALIAAELFEKVTVNSEYSINVVLNEKYSFLTGSSTVEPVRCK